MSTIVALGISCLIVITMVCGHCSWVGLIIIFYSPDMKGSPEGGGFQYYLVRLTYYVLERFSLTMSQFSCMGMLTFSLCVKILIIISYNWFYMPFKKSHFSLLFHIYSEVWFLEHFPEFLDLVLMPVSFYY